MSKKQSSNDNDSLHWCRVGLERADLNSYGKCFLSERNDVWKEKEILMSYWVFMCIFEMFVM